MIQCNMKALSLVIFSQLVVRYFMRSKKDKSDS